MIPAYTRKNLKEQATNKKTLNLSSLYEISNIIGAACDLDKLLDLALKTMLTQTEADSGSLMLLDYDRQELYIAAAKGLSAKITAKARVKVGQVVAGIVAKSKKPLLINNKNFYSIFKKRPRPGLKSSLCVPLMVSDKLIGVINLNRIPGHKAYTSKDLDAILKFASESAIAIHNAKLYIEAEQKIQHLFRFNVISCALNSALNQESLIDILTDCMRELFAFDIYTLALIFDDDYYLLICSKCKLSKSTVSQLKKNLTMLLSGLKRKKIRNNKIEVYLKNISGTCSKTKKVISPKYINSVLNAPLIAKGNTLGMLSVLSLKKEGFDQKDQQSLTTLANQAAVAFENSNLYKNLRKTYLSTIKALAQAIEEKDLYTRGHSELVSKYAVAIANAMQLPGKFIESIQIAGILHDIGKIGIPEKILSKPGTLSFQEYKVIKKHPAIGVRILYPVSFFWANMGKPGSEKKAGKNGRKKSDLDKQVPSRLTEPLRTTIDILKATDLSDEIKTMIYHHHERFGGGGYPAGIKGNKIPLGSRILAVADTFEAMTAHRPYRKAFPISKAVKLLRKCSPDQLDPKIVEIFLKLIRKKCIKVK